MKEYELNEDELKWIKFKNIDSKDFILSKDKMGCLYCSYLLRHANRCLNYGMHI